MILKYIEARRDRPAYNVPADYHSHRTSPMRSFLSLAMLLGIASTAFPQAAVPAGTAPKIGLASATEKDGKVRIEVFELREVMRMKVGDGGDVFIEKRHWLELTTWSDERQIVDR